MAKLFLFYFFLVTLHFMPCNAFESSIGEKKRIVFIVNPISHEIKGLNLEQIIEKNLDLNQFEYKIVYTQYPQHATQLALDAMDAFDIIAAVGGDGTVNEVGKALINSNAILAIIPVGSGNGLARHLRIPVGLDQGIKALNQGIPITIDTAKFNDKIFLGVAGIGFDAHIAERFANFKKRGFLSYAQVALKEFARYKPKEYQITIDGKKISRKAFILTIANSSQYGNDFMIAPKARIDDGYLDLVIIDDIPWYSTLRLLYQFKHGIIDRSKHFETYRFKELTMDHPRMGAHIDGEPLTIQNEIKITLQPKSLKVLVPAA